MDNCGYFRSWQKASRQLFFRSSHQRYSEKKCVLENFANFTKKNTCVGVFFEYNYRPLLKRDSNSCFPVKFAKYLKTPILKNIWTANDCFWLLWFPRFRTTRRIRNLQVLIVNKQCLNNIIWQNVCNVVVTLTHYDWFPLKFIWCLFIF